MMVLVSYDVSTVDKRGQARLRRVSKACLDYGQRVQNSVYECIVDPAQWVTLKSNLVGLINPAEDSLRFYFLGASWINRVEHIGAKPSTKLDGPLVV